MTSEQTGSPRRGRCSSWLSSFQAACSGLVHTLQTQRNMRVHVVVAAIVMTSAAWVNSGPVEWGLLAFAIGLVLVAELLNTAIEAVVDLASPEWHALAKQAKDAAAAGVLIAAITAAFVGCCIFGPQLWTWLSG